MTDQAPTSGDPIAAEQELARSSQVFLTELDRLQELEHRKKEMSPEDPGREPLAREIEDVTVDLMSLGRYQTRLVQLQKLSLGEVPPVPRATTEILDEWRAAERQLHHARAAMERASDDADRLREEHRMSVQPEGR